MTKTKHRMSEKASAKLNAFFTANNVKDVSPEELEAARADPDWGDDVEIAFEIMPPKRGRPKKGETRAPVVGKTIKRSPDFWIALERKAKARGMTLHEAMREALDKWLAA